MNKAAYKLGFVRMLFFASSLVAVFASIAPAQSTRYVQVNVAANRRDPSPGGLCAHGCMRIDPNLVNPWGLAFSAGSPFWTSNEGTGTSTLYRHFGQRVPLVVTVPPASGTGKGKPTGIVQNSTTTTNIPTFVVSANGKSGPASFIFSTLDGTISGWNPNVNATQAIVMASDSGASYTGLAIGSTTSGSFLYATNAAENNVYVFDTTFANVGAFSDPNIPSGFVPYGIQAIGGQVYVTYASFSKPGGFVDIFNPDATVKRVVSDASGAHLNQPWGLAMAPANFGAFSNALLVGNVKDGMINAFNPNTGAFVGWLSYTNGKPITIPGLWALQFGRGSVNNGKTNQLFFTAGPNNFADGLLGMIFPLIPNGPGLVP
jgi:uncharacterized protein (TIGR03118 family)